MMTQCAKHVDYQLPKGLTRVNFMLNVIECKDPILNAAISMVKGNKDPTRKMNNFEYVAE